MGQVSIDGNDYEIYGTQADATIYFGGAIHGTAWFAADDDTQAKALVTSTRMLDRQVWQGTKTAPSPGQTLDWPRTGVVDREGNPVDPNTVPEGIVFGSYELANILISNAAVQDTKDAGSNISSVGAGSARVAFFRPTIGTLGRFPTIVQELVGEFLAGAVAHLGIFVSGIQESQFAVWDFGFSTPGGLK